MFAFCFSFDVVLRFVFAFALLQQSLHDDLDHAWCCVSFVMSCFYSCLILLNGFLVSVSFDDLFVQGASSVSMLL